MLIAIPVEKNTSDTAVCPSFGRTPFFLVHDTETKKDNFVDNTAISCQGGAGIKAAQSIVDRGVAVLITPRCGQNAADVLKAADIKIYRSTEGDAKENISAFAEGKLSPLEDIHPGFHDHERK